ncbi:MAG: hypothetical protein EA340_08460 [Nitriliruptor sp.]|nr:MAG: hypothetical protein EA340_08460 [Nitriliruptor sp.]
MDQLQIRKAEPADAAAVGRLLGVLGHTLPDDETAARLRWFSRSGADHLLVAVSDREAVGVLTLTVVPRLTHDGPFARITFLGVPEGPDLQWIERALLGEAERLARRHRCTSMEVMADRHPEDDTEGGLATLSYRASTEDQVPCVKPLPPPTTVRI